MRIDKLLLSWLSLVSVALIAQAQGTFQNLDFESANVSGFPAGGVPITNGLPGWAGYITGPGGYQVNTVIYNTVSIGAAAISLQGPASTFSVLEGSYTVLLQPQFFGFPVPPNNPVPALAQSGMIPASARSIRFFGQGAVFQVNFAGQQIPISILSSTPSYDIYGGDISAFANQAGELRFTGGGYLDAIQFSDQAVPEPSTFGLFGLGALFLGWRLVVRLR